MSRIFHVNRNKAEALKGTKLKGQGQYPLTSGFEDFIHLAHKRKFSPTAVIASGSGRRCSLPAIDSGRRVKPYIRAWVWFGSSVTSPIEKVKEVTLSITEAKNFKGLLGECTNFPCRWGRHPSPPPTGNEICKIWNLEILQPYTDTNLD